MESSHQYFCHTCQTKFSKAASLDEEVPCQNCGDIFVELIENQEQLSQINNIYKTKESRRSS